MPTAADKKEGMSMDYIRRTYGVPAKRRALARRLPAKAATRPAVKLLGTPISELSGRPGLPGFGAFCDLAASWGYD